VVGVNKMETKEFSFTPIDDRFVNVKCLLEFRAIKDNDGEIAHDIDKLFNKFRF
jgi:hypothetical protein